jgi:hypothetical protein
VPLLGLLVIIGAVGALVLPQFFASKMLEQNPAAGTKPRPTRST